jgi:hypothetical protein
LPQLPNEAFADGAVLSTVRDDDQQGETKHKVSKSNTIMLYFFELLKKGGHIATKL